MSDGARWSHHPVRAGWPPAGRPARPEHPPPGQRHRPDRRSVRSSATCTTRCPRSTSGRRRMRSRHRRPCGQPACECRIASTRPPGFHPCRGSRHRRPAAPAARGNGSPETGRALPNAARVEVRICLRRFQPWLLPCSRQLAAVNPRIFAPPGDDYSIAILRLGQRDGRRTGHYGKIAAAAAPASAGAEPVPAAITRQASP
jgi:hypothetical protein